MKKWRITKQTNQFLLPIPATHNVSNPVISPELCGGLKSYSVLFSKSSSGNGRETKNMSKPFRI